MVPLVSSNPHNEDSKVATRELLGGEEEEETGVPLRMGVTPPWASVAHCLPRVAVAATHLNTSNTLLLLWNGAQPGKEWGPLRQYLCCSVVVAVSFAGSQHLQGAIGSAAGDKSEACAGGGGGADVAQ